MAKKLILLSLALTIILFSSIVIFGSEAAAATEPETENATDVIETENTAEAVWGRYFKKNIIINGERIVNHNLQYALYTYNDALYTPLTPELGEIYGVAFAMDWENGVLRLAKAPVARQNISTNWLKNERIDALLTVIAEADVQVYATVAEMQTRAAAGRMELNGLPLLTIDGRVYIPLRAFADSGLFNWDIHFDGYYGICISTIDGIPAETYWNEQESMENRGLVAYMRHVNAGITAAYGQELLFSFKTAGEVFGVDPKLIMAIAQKESKFNTFAVGPGGAAGMMQVMPATGVAYGLSSEQLKNHRIAINFASMYIGQRLVAYNGDQVSALSAYNQGSTRVNRGRFTTGYANSVLALYHNMSNFLIERGYIAE